MEINPELWKMRLLEMEKRHNASVEEMMNQFEASVKSRVDHESAEMAARYNSEKIHYEKELSQARAKLAEAESRIGLLAAELDKLTNIIRERDAEREVYRNQILQMERDKHLLAEETRLRADAEKTREVEIRLQEVTAVFLREKKSLETTLRARSEAILDLERKLQIIIQENEKMANLNAQRIDDLEGAEKALEALMANHRFETEELRRRFELNLKATVDRELRDASAQAEADRRSLETQLRETNAKLSENLVVMNSLTNESQSLRSRLDEKTSAFADLQRRYTQLEETRRKNLDEVRGDIEALRHTMVEAGEAEARFAAEKTAYETQLLQFRYRINELESQNEAIHSELEKVALLAIDRLKELEAQKLRTATAEDALHRELDELRAEVEEYRKRNLDVKELAVKFSGEKAAYETQIRQLKQLNENNKVEIQKLYELMNQRKKEYEGQIQQITQLRGELQASREENLNLLKHYQGNAEALETYQREVELTKAQARIAEMKVEKNDLMLIEKNKELVHRIEELEALKLQYEESHNAAHKVIEDYSLRLRNLQL
eukprot:TRINITY_DN1735_c0_g1_i5.p1 TRINITY_DN1735_c0_g1~~TRINITY_DN1735_c0_g1_i5.p1  ORF type:complete len:552 (+),score=169.74 TRINITY_DN1735_c0_g1_i5:64-1719(+)